MRKGLVLFWSLVIINLGTLGLWAAQLPFSGIALAAANSIILIYLINFAFNTSGLLNKKVAWVKDVVKNAQLKIQQQEQFSQKIATALELIGNNQELDNLLLEGDAGLAISNLQNKLKAVKQEESQRTWAAQGIAQISEIRKNTLSLEDYGFQTISQLIKNVEATVGTFYIKNVEDPQNPTLELLATYAYGYKRIQKEKLSIGMGEGLVGQCAYDGEVITLQEVPNNYLRITSALGGGTPRSIVIVPIIFREEVYGVIEMASFHAFEEYKIEFVKKACENIGVELSSNRAHEQSRKLIEQSREEELRQSLEEMKATQREMLVKEEELQQQLINTQRAQAMAEAERRKNEAILEGCMDAVISFNQNGTVEYFNKAAEDIFGIQRDTLIGLPVTQILDLRITENYMGELAIITQKGNQVSLRTELNAYDKKGEEISLLLTSTQVKIDSGSLFTLFAQKVSVELF